ncbi:MAG: hypothetical protein ACE3JQ_00735 [Paenisporosarcina sp.]
MFRFVTLSINVENLKQVDEVMKKAKYEGAHVISEANDAFWGGRSGA